MGWAMLDIDKMKEISKKNIYSIHVKGQFIKRIKHELSDDDLNELRKIKSDIKRYIELSELELRGAYDE